MKFMENIELLNMFLSKGIRYFMFQFIEMSKALYHVSVGLRKSGIIRISIIGCYDENWKMGIFAFDFVQYVPPLEPIKKQV